METGLVERWVDHDGTTLYIRAMRIDDAPALGALFDRLSPNDRRLRFHGAVNGLSREWLETLAGVDQQRHVALAVTAGRHDTAPLLAEARWVLDGSDLAAEFAIAVSPAWRRRGIGERCMRALIRTAAARGVMSLHGAVLADNAPMLALLARCGFACTPKRGDQDFVVAEAMLDAMPRVAADAARRPRLTLAWWRPRARIAS